MADDPTKTAGNGDQGTGGETPPANWAEYVKLHPEADALHKAETAGLHKALDTEREAHKTASQQLRDLAKTADEKTAAKLNEMATEKDAKIKQLEAKDTFNTQAVKAGCHDLERAWTVSQASGQSVADLKSDEVWGPALFGAPRKASAHAGAGTGSDGGPPAGTIDALLRAPRH